MCGWEKEVEKTVAVLEETRVSLGFLPRRMLCVRLARCDLDRL